MVLQRPRLTPLAFLYLALQRIVVDRGADEAAQHQAHHRGRERRRHQKGDAHAGDRVGQGDVKLGRAILAGRDQGQDEADGHQPAPPTRTLASPPNTQHKLSLKSSQ